MRPALCALLCVAALAIEACGRKVQPRVAPAPAPAPSVVTTTFEATAYCAGTTTAAGVRVAKGMIAADPAVLPMGTTVRISGVPAPYEGTYSVMDTGANIRGRRIDLYMTSCEEARRFGRRQVEVVVVSRPVGRVR